MKMDTTMAISINEMAEKIASNAMNVYEYKGKTIAEWIQELIAYDKIKTNNDDLSSVLKLEMQYNKKINKLEEKIFLLEDQVNVFRSAIIRQDKTILMYKDLNDILKKEKRILEEAEKNLSGVKNNE